MTKTNIAVGIIPEDLTNIVVTVEWAPEEKGYEVSLLTHDGGLMAGHEYMGLAGEAIGYSPKPHDLDVLVIRGLEHRMSLPAQLTRSLALFSHFEWFSPTEMSREDREKFGAGA
ncbi:hypothetical protein ACGFZC_16085 [[Kitasatospora] papulosa]|uniref:hypothetical protein n=1 Tax=[Kitasatospora] papulosa TaxID=1464011 RepID=UPI00371C6932